MAYDAQLGSACKLDVPIELQSRVIAVHFKQSTTTADVSVGQLHSFIIMGVYVPATGTIPEKKSFIELVFSTRTHLQKVNKCEVIMGGDFKSFIFIFIIPYVEILAKSFSSNIP